MLSNKPEQQSSPDPQEDIEQKKKISSEVRSWREKIDEAETYRNKIAGRYHWREIIEGYKCHLDASLAEQDIYVPPLNYFFAYIKTEIPSISLRDPKIKINPKKGSSIKSARILEKALAYLWRTQRTKRENKKNILDVKTVGHTWFKTGYSGTFGTVEQDGGKAFEYVEAESFFGYRVPWDQIVFNPDALDPPFDCGWIAQEVWLPLEDVKSNQLFDKTVTADLEPSALNEGEKTSTDKKKDSGSNPDRGKSDPSVSMVKLYEVWDKTHKVKFVICDQCDYYIQSPVEWPYHMKGFPFAYLTLNDNPDSAYGIPDCFAFEPQIFELTKVRATQLDHLKRYNRQLIGRKGALSDDAKVQFSQGITGAYIEADINENESIGNVMAPIPYPPLPSDIYGIERLIKEDLINVSGQSPQERGATSQTSTRTFRELAQMDRGAKNRRSDQIDAFEDFLEDIARNRIALLQQFADVPFYVSVTGDDAQEVMTSFKERASAGAEGAITAPDGFTFTKEDIQGEFDVEVVAGSTAPLDSENRMERLTQILTELPQLGVIPGGPVIAAIGFGLAQELDMPEVELAIKAEQELAQKQAAENKQKQDLMQGQMIADRSAELELKSQKEARDQNELILRAYEILAKLQAEKNKEKEGKAE